MSKLEFEAFKADIAEHGILEPLQASGDGVVIDGHHRLRAALELAIEELPVRLVEPADPVAWMLGSALQRRHLSQSQKACLAVELHYLQQAGGQVATLPPGRRLRDLVAATGGVCARTAQEVLTVHRRDRDLFEQIKAGQIPAHKARLELERRERYRTVRPTPPLPGGLYELILADPPWQLGNPGSAYAPEQYYPTLPLAEIAAIPVPAADDALLYLWAVNSHLPDALQVMAAWGFAYCGCEVWVKPSIGMGVWTRNRHELLLIGRQGNASPAPRRRLLDSVIEAPRGRHSEKPALIPERLGHLYPERSKLELFARGTARPGWTAWGNQLEEQAA